MRPNYGSYSLWWILMYIYRVLVLLETERERVMVFFNMSNLSMGVLFYV